MALLLSSVLVHAEQTSVDTGTKTGSESASAAGLSSTTAHDSAHRNTSHDRQSERDREHSTEQASHRTEQRNPYPETFNLQATAEANRDVDEEFEGVCPITGTVRDLKIAGNRLMYESRYMEAYDCFKRALHQWFKPSRQPPPAAPMDSVRFRELFPRSAHLPEDDMDSSADLTRVLRLRNRAAYEFAGVRYNPTFPDAEGEGDESDEELDMDADMDIDPEAQTAQMRLPDD